jgi:hypothetical protein
MRTRPLGRIFGSLALLAAAPLIAACEGGETESAAAQQSEVKGSATRACPSGVMATGSGLPPKISGEMPASGSEIAGRTAQLSVTIDDPDSTAFTATFHLRQITTGDDFTIVVLPDTQYYTRPGDNPQQFHDQTQWIIDNAEAYNIVGAIHNGDIVDNASVDSQWVVADAAMKRLDDARSKRFPEGVPYGTCAGNHDQSPNGKVNGTTSYNAHFGPQRFAGKSWFGGTFAPGKADENWVQFSAGGLEFVVVNLQYGATAREPSVLAWTRSIFQQHPDAFGIVNSHRIVEPNGNFGPPGQSIYDAIKDIDNVQLLTSGHFTAEKRRTDVFEGHTVHSMVADYQGRANGGGGSFRVWEFSPKNDEVTVRTFTTSTKKFETDADSEFTLKVDLAGAAKGTFRPLVTVDPATAPNATATLAGFVPNQVFEWYVTVTDCTHTVTSPRYRFRTK